ncbi:MAG: NADPH-dependent F420 reductase [Candidatus Bathyarchaeota archaeon]|nr:NADPH-dependent F420 reductase [Candidatus Bathyarchaeota archaeon]
MSNPNPNPTIAIIGGTGREGSAIAGRFAKAGLPVIIGSRDPAKAKSFATMVNLECKLDGVTGCTNCEAAQKADIIILAVPYTAINRSIAEIKDCTAGKIVINIASSLDMEKKTRAFINPTGSIAQEIQTFLGPEAKVIDAFQNICPEQLLNYTGDIKTDVLVVGGDRATRDIVINLINRTGITAYDAGPIQNAVAVETLTAALIYINVRYKIVGAGIHISGLPHPNEKQ